jgi:hypothetical protein
VSSEYMMEGISVVCVDVMASVVNHENLKERKKGKELE